MLTKVLILVLLVLVQVTFSLFAVSTLGTSGSQRYKFYECYYQCENQKNVVILDLRTTQFWSNELSDVLLSRCENGCPCQKVARDKPLKLDFSKFEPIVSGKCLSKRGSGEEPKEDPKDDTKIQPKKRDSLKNKGNKVLETEDLEIEFLY
jgi:hypothetical protein